MLVVEDHEPFREFICALLQERPGVQIIEASNGLDGIQKAKQLDPDLILFDIGLPKLNGIEAAKAVREFAPHIKLLFITQESSSDVVRETFRIGAQAYVHKSHASSDLMPAIEAVLEGRPFIGNGLEFGQDAGRARTDGALRESEESFRLIANAAPAMIRMSGPDKLCVYFNRRWLEFTGRPLDAELGNGWADAIHPEDLRHCMESYAQAFDRHEPFRMQYRLLRHDGKYRWILDSGAPRFNAGREFAGYIASAIDINEQKLAEEALSTMSRRLIEAQEDERRWIARELHDDICQRLSLLILNLERLSDASLDATRAGVARSIELALDLSGDIRVLSDQLHSSSLEYLGLAVTATTYCSELAEQYGVKIDVHLENVPTDLSWEISLCLYRVLQEGLQNAIKFSGAREFQVSIQGLANEISLTVRDSGIGFDASEAARKGGLGLISLAERLKLVNGRISIDSQLHRGTKIHARVPLERMKLS
jgi:PAS domain S-box-containing protein